MCEIVLLFTWLPLFIVSFIAMSDRSESGESDFFAEAGDDHEGELEPEGYETDAEVPGEEDDSSWPLLQELSAAEVQKKEDSSLKSG